MRSCPLGAGASSLAHPRSPLSDSATHQLADGARRRRRPLLVIERLQMDGEVRRVVDSEGTHWLVYELSGVSYDRRRSLVFESDTSIRRVRSFPENWRSLPDEELLAISWSA